MASREPTTAEPDAPRQRPQRSISDSRHSTANAAQQLARLREEKLLRQALRSAALLPLPPDADAARDVNDSIRQAATATAASVPQATSPQLRAESSATAWASAQSTLETYRDARSAVDSGSDSAEDEQTSALTPLRPDQQEAVRAAGLTACAPAQSHAILPAPTEACRHDDEEWSPSAGAAVPLAAGPPRQLQRISKGGSRPTAAAPGAPQSSHPGLKSFPLEDSSDDDWQAAVSAGLGVAETRKPLRRLQKAGTVAQGGTAQAIVKPASDDAADALENAMAGLAVSADLDDADSLLRALREHGLHLGDVLSSHPELGCGLRRLAVHCLRNCRSHLRGCRAV